MQVTWRAGESTGISSATQRAKGCVETAKKVFCMKCEKHLPETDIGRADLSTWRRDREVSEKARFKTCYSGTRPKKPSGWSELARRGQTTCSRCTEERKLSAFGAKHLERQLLNKEIHRAACLLCDTTSLWGQRGRPHACNKCKKSLPLGAFSVDTRK